MVTGERACPFTLARESPAVNGRAKTRAGLLTKF